MTYTAYEVARDYERVMLACVIKLNRHKKMVCHK